MALSGVVVFLYGSMVWGVLPIDPQISWEGHLFGAVAGLILAFYYKNVGPQRPKYSWEIEEELEREWLEKNGIEDAVVPDEIKNTPSDGPIQVKYTYVEEKKPPFTD